MLRQRQVECYGVTFYAEGGGELQVMVTRALLHYSRHSTPDVADITLPVVERSPRHGAPRLPLVQI